MTQDPQLDVATFLAAAGLNLTLGTNLFTGEVLAVSSSVPAESVFVEAQRGERPRPYLGAGNMWPVEVDITVRGPAGNREAARLRARAIRDALHRAAISGYVIVLSVDAEPEHVGADDAECHEYTFTLTLEWSA